jgi:hypothetical protein
MQLQVTTKLVTKRTAAVLVGLSHSCDVCVCVFQYTRNECSCIIRYDIVWYHTII